MLGVDEIVMGIVFGFLICVPWWIAGEIWSGARAIVSATVESE